MDNWRQIADPARSVLRKSKRTAERRALKLDEPGSAGGDDRPGSTLTADAPAPSGSNEKRPDASVSNARPSSRRLGGQRGLELVASNDGMGGVPQGLPRPASPIPLLLVIEGAHASTPSG